MFHCASPTSYRASLFHPLLQQRNPQITNINMADSTTNLPAVYAASSSSQPLSPPQPQLEPPSAAEIAATVQPAPSNAELSATGARVPENMMYKNRLQEFTQKSSIALPLYQTVNEGTPHAPRFRCTVWVNEKSYTTRITFSNRKAAEQDGARLALESLPNVIKDEASPLVSENILFSKSILNEYATKMNKDRPTYDSVQLQGMLPTFVSTLVFNGTKYTGEASKSKKDAEQLAARRAILSILDEPNSGTLFEIVKSKSRISAAIKPPSVDASNISEIANAGRSSVSLDHKDKEVAGIVIDNDTETKIELRVPSKILSFCQVSDAQTPVAFVGAPVLPSVSFPIASQQPVGDGSSSKKRRRNKNKANKKARLESPLPVAAAFPVNGMPSCSVAQ